MDKCYLPNSYMKEYSLRRLLLYMKKQPNSFFFHMFSVSYLIKNPTQRSSREVVQVK